MRLLDFVLVFIIIYVPEQLHFPTGLGLPGLNVLNLLFLFALILHLTSHENTNSTVTAPLKSRFLFFFGALFLSFIIAQAGGVTNLIEDATKLKEAIFYMLLYFLYFHAVQDIKTIRILFLVVLLVAGLASIEVIKEAADYGFGGNFNYTHRASGPFGSNWRNSNRAGVFFTIFVPYFIALALYYKQNKFIRIASVVAIILCVFAVFFTYSRQSYFILAFLLMASLYKKSKALTIIGLVVILNYAAWAPDSVTQRIGETQQVDEQGDENLDASTESRFILWAGAWEMIKEKPWGIGFNRFKSEIGNYCVIPNKDAHNHYVLTTAESGILGFVTLVMLLLSFGAISYLWKN